MPLEIMIGGGDVILKTEHGDAYLVGSQVLCAVSPVFRAMFGRNSGFSEAINVRRANILGYPPAVINVDDDPFALGLILKVLHHRNDLLPDEITFKQLTSTAEVSNKYEVIRPLKQTIDRLSKQKQLDETVYEDGYEDWILISYIFGYEDIFLRATENVILNGGMSRGELRVGGWFLNKTLSSSTPPAVIGMPHHASINTPMHVGY